VQRHRPFPSFGSRCTWLPATPLAASRQPGGFREGARSETGETFLNVPSPGPRPAMSRLLGSGRIQLLPGRLVGSSPCSHSFPAATVIETESVRPASAAFSREGPSLPRVNPRQEASSPDRFANGTKERGQLTPKHPRRWSPHGQGVRSRRPAGRVSASVVGNLLLSLPGERSGKGAIGGLVCPRPDCADRRNSLPGVVGGRLNTTQFPPGGRR
jgi:hypothetical protein